MSSECVQSVFNIEVISSCSSSSVSIFGIFLLVEMGSFASCFCLFFLVEMVFCILFLFIFLVEMDAGLKLRCMESVVGAKLRPRA